MGEMQVETEVPVEVEAQQEEKLWAGNFKSPDELEQAYTELRRMESRRNEELATLRKVAEKVEYLEEQLTAPQRQQQHQAIEQSIIEALDSDDPYDRMRAQAWITEQVIQTKLQEFQPPRPAVDMDMTAFVADQRMSQKYQDWPALKAEVAQVIQERPHLFPVTESSSVDDVVRNLDTVYEVAKARHTLRAGSQAQSDAAAAAAAMKEAAQTMQGGSSRPVSLTPEQEYWQQIKNAKTGLY